MAKHFGIPFYVAAPFTTIDFNCQSGQKIVIEERSAKGESSEFETVSDESEELTEIGGKRIAAEGIDVWNPAFDVAPAHLIDGIVTERGVFKPDQLKNRIKS